MAPKLRGGALALGLLVALPRSAGGARVQFAEEVQVEGEGLEPSFRLAGVPIYGARPAPKMRLASGALPPKRAWVVMMKPDSTNGEIHAMCQDSADEDGCLEGHPTDGGVPFAEMELSDVELEALLQSRPGRVEFVEADKRIVLEPEPRGRALDDPLLLANARMPGDHPDDASGGSFAQVADAEPPWGIQRVGASRLRGQELDTGKGVHVYVVDSGVRVSHHEFEGRAIPTLDMTGGRLKECNPTDLTCAEDSNGHGTHCAATVGGKTVGVASGATIHAVRVFGSDGSTMNSWILSALDWIIDHKRLPGVVSMSLGGEGQSKSDKVAIDSMVKGGLTVVVAAGNENADACQYSPSFVANAITVGSTTPADYRSGFSNYGSCVNIFAPGSQVVSAAHDSDAGLSTKSGTSMACPHVAGAAARLLARNPDWKANDVMKEFQRSGERSDIGDSKGSPNLMLVVDPLGLKVDSTCPDHVLISGSTEFHASKMGKYTKASLTTNGRVVYKRGEDLLYYARSKWQIADTMDFLALRSFSARSQAACPSELDPGLWLVWTGEDWEDVRLKVEAGNTCPKSVVVSGSKQVRMAVKGLFTKTNLIQDDRPIYQNKKDLYLYYLQGKWMIDAQHATSKSLAYAEHPAECPNQIDDSALWQVRRKGTKEWEADDSVKVTKARPLPPPPKPR